jgi:hypothetical protein
MPTFTIRDSQTGRTVTVQGDAPPTEAEMEQLFAAPAERPNFAPTPYGVGGGVSVAPLPYQQEITEGALRYGVPAVAAMGTMGASIPLQMAAGAGAGLAGEAAARASAGQDLTSPQAMGQIVKSGALGAIPARAGARVLETAATMGGGSALAEALGAQVSGEEGAVLESGLMSGSFGAGLGLIGKVAGKFSTAAAENAQTREFLSEVGIKNPVLPQVLPEYAPLTNRMAAGNPELANQVASTQSAITREIFDIVGDVPTNSELAGKMRPMVQAAQEAELAAQNAGSVYRAAQSRLTALESAPQQTANWQAAYEDAALAKLQAVRREAAANFAVQQKFADVGSISSYANDLTKTVLKLDDAVKDTSTALYSKTGLNGADEIVDREALLSAARRSLKDQADSPVGKKIIEAIENVGKVDEEAPAALSWNQFKNLRDEMSAKWADLDENYVGRAEALAGSVYRSLGTVFRKSINENLGPESAKAFDAAQKFWYEWSQTRDSNFTRSVFGVPRREVGRGVVSGIKSSTLTGLADGVLAGDVQAVENVVRATKLVGKYAPEVAANMQASVGRAIRGAMIDKYKNDPAALITALSEQVKKPDVAPFIKMAGFGNTKTIDALGKAVRTYKKEDLSQELIESALASGDVALGLASGVLAKQAKEAATAALINDSARASQKLTEARKTAAKANLDAAQVTEAFNAVKNDPVLAVFTGKGKHGFTEEAGKVGKGTLSDFVIGLSPDVGRRFMGALRQQDKELADLVSRKILADELYRISGIERKAKDASSSIDVDKLRRFYNPTLPQDKQRSDHIRFLVGDVFDSRMKRFFTNLDKVIPRLREADLLTTELKSPVVSTLAGAAQPVINIPGISALGASVFATRIGRILEKPRFDLLTYMATDPDFLTKAAKFENFADMVRSLPMQRGYMYASNAGLRGDMASTDADSTQGQPTR